MLDCRRRGLAYKETATELGISMNTVRWNLKNVFLKTQAHSTIQALNRVKNP